MNILILNWRDIVHPLSGGAEISLMEHARYWRKKGADVVWFSSTFKNAKKEEIIDDIKIIRRGSHYTVHIYAYIQFLKGNLGKPDIIIDSFHFLPFFTPLYAKKSKLIGLVNETAGKIWFSNIFFPFAILGYFIEKLSFQVYKNSHFITGSFSTQQDIARLGVSKKQIHIIHHGIKRVFVNNSIKKEKHPTLVFLGRISRDKGIHDALHVFMQVKEIFVDTQLWIIGKEEKKDMLRNILKSTIFTPFKKDIFFFGFVSENEKFRLLKKSWILIHPSIKEGWGLTVIEANAVGTVAVGYDVQGLRDSIKNNKTGILVTGGVEEITEAVLVLLQNKQTYNQLVINARSWSKQFLWSRSVKESYKLLKLVLLRKNYSNNNILC